MRNLLRLLPLLLSLLAAFFLSHRPGDVPPLKWVLPSGSAAASLPPFGKLLSPFTGFWQNTDRLAELPPETTAELPGLQAEATVRYDERRVPHIFAENEHDLYLLQGYLTARDRLWQMQTQVRQAGGRLAEFAGPAALPADRFFIRLGMREAARNTLAMMRQDEATRRALEAYTAGVNAYIGRLSPGEYPIEYKLLDYEPTRWTPLKTVLLLKLMAWDLTGHSMDFEQTNALRTYGPAVMDSLWPHPAPWSEPVIPAETPWNFEPKAVPPPPPNKAAPASPNQALGPVFRRPGPHKGSNNWAINGGKSATGHPILANDPHLGLTLPSIWYEIQLHAPGLNAYGASLPGAPGIIIGFNEHVAWGVTNVGADVLDWYRIRFRDTAKQAEYWHAGRWKDTRTVRDTIPVRGGEDVIEDVVYTHHGPVMSDYGDTLAHQFVPPGHAVRWLAHEASNEFLTFYELNRAQHYADYKRALRHYDTPAQNFVYADIDDNIALWANGKYPLKWEDQGRYLLDGTDPRHDWRGWVPRKHVPHVLNPPRGFVSSANQIPADTTYPYYLDWHNASFERGKRINSVLRRWENAPPDSLRLLQVDGRNLRAEKALPKMLAHLPKAKLNAGERKPLALFREWRYSFEAGSQAAVLFDAWFTHFQDTLWGDEFGSGGYQPPRGDATAWLLYADTAARWYDDQRTPKHRETLGELLLMSYRAALMELRTTQGEPAEWRWSKRHGTHIPHLSHAMPAFSRRNLHVGGCKTCVNATKTTNGPSWRMVVALHPDPNKAVAYGIYPGGQSGNPGSRYYDNMVDSWAAGRLDRLVFLRSAGAAHPDVISTASFSPPGN